LQSSCAGNSDAVACLLFEVINLDNNKSSLITTGLRESFRKGTSKLANRVCYGYAQDERGHLVIYGPEAEILRWIFDRYLDGDSLGKIVDGLAERSIPSPTGKIRWNREALLKLISNEKYAEIVRLQKTVVQDGKQVKNQNISQYIYESNHPAIISAEAYAQIQIMRLGHSRIMEREPMPQLDW